MSGCLHIYVIISWIIYDIMEIFHIFLCQKLISHYRSILTPGILVWTMWQTLLQDHHSNTLEYTQPEESEGERVYCFTFVCVSVCLFVSNSFAIFSATINHSYIVIEIFSTLCLDMPYGRIHFCTNKTSTSYEMTAYY